MATGNQYFNPTNPGYAGNVERALNKKANAEAYEKMKGLVQMYNDNPGQFNDVEAEQIALIAKTIGLPFNREVKPIANLMYGAAEGLTFGFLPDSFRPEERGESVYGRSGANKFFSGVGMVGGGLLGLRAGTAALGLAGRGATAAGSRILSGLGGVTSKAGNMASQASTAASGMAGRAGTNVSNFYAGARSGFAGNATRLSAPGSNIGGPGFVMNPTAPITGAEIAGAQAGARARSIFNAGYYYGGQVLNKTGQAVGNMRSGLSSYVG